MVASCSLMLAHMQRALLCGMGSCRRQSGSGKDAGCAESEDRGAEKEAASARSGEQTSKAQASKTNGTGVPVGFLG